VVKVGEVAVEVAAVVSADMADTAVLVGDRHQEMKTKIFSRQRYAKVYRGAERDTTVRSLAMTLLISGPGSS